MQGLPGSWSYTSLKSAFDAINSGAHSGYITINVVSNSTETATASLNASGTGSTIYDSILITPSGGSWSVMGTISSAALIDLNGADYVKIDGLNTGGNSLTISNLSTAATSGTSTIRLYNDAKKNTIKNCNILGSSTMTLTTNGGNIFISTAFSGGTGNDSNKIENCIIGGANNVPPFKGVYFNGTATNSSTYYNGNQIIGCEFANMRGTAIYIGGGTNSTNISNNHFYQNTSLTYASTYSAIYVNSSTNAGDINISGNYIGGSSTFCGGTPATITGAVLFQPIYYAGQTTQASKINGNRINNFSITTSTTTANHSCIFLQGGRIFCGKETGNYVGDTNNLGSITFNYTGSSASSFYCITTAGVGSASGFDTVDISNNVLSGVTVTGTNGLSLRGIDLSSNSTGYFNINNNLIGSNTTANSLNNSTNNSIIGIITRFTSSSYIHNITNNTIANLQMYNGTSTGGATVRGIMCSNVNSFNCSNNSIKNLSSAVTGISTSGSTAAVVGLSFTASGTLGQTIRNNYIKNLSTTASSVVSNSTGLYVAVGSTGTNIIERNRVHFLSSASTANSIITGLLIGGGNANYQNNEIILGIDSNGNSISNAINFNGIRDSLGNNNFYFNSVNISGDNVDPQNSTFAFNSITTGTTRKIINNIFTNNRNFSFTTTTGNYAIGLAGTITGGGISNTTIKYNLYNAPGSGGIIIRNGSNDYLSLSSWQSAANLLDSFSQTGDPQFAQIDRLQSQNSSIAFLGLNNLGVTNDIIGNTRVNFRIGAYDNIYNPLAISIQSFTGSWEKINPILNWDIYNEHELKLLRIERSEDGVNFKTIKSIEKPENKQTIFSNYFEDYSAINILSNDLYYKLQIETLSGKSFYSNTIRLTQKKNFERPTIYPNPFSDVINVRNGFISEIMDANGKIIFIEDKKEMFNTENLHSGLYLLKVKNNLNEIYTIKAYKN